MGVLASLFERREAVTPDQDLPARHWLYRLFGGGGTSDAGVIVDEVTATNTLLVMACVRIIAETIASLSLPVYKRMSPRGRERARSHGLYRVLNTQANAYMTPFTYFERMGAHLALWGNHYAVIARTKGEVTDLWPVHPRRVTPYQAPDGELRYRIDAGEHAGDYRDHDILHVPGLAMDGLRGLSPLSAMRQAIGITVAAESYGARFFGNDARPDIILRHPAQLTPEAGENLRRSFAERHGGGKRGIAVLEEGMDLTVVGMPPADTQMLETRRFQVQELARYFRIPPHMLADVAGSTSWGSGIEQQSLGFVVYTMRPWLVRIEQEINRKLFLLNETDTYYAEFLVDSLLRGDVAARSSYYQSGRNWGYLSANDIRDLENMPLIEGGDTYLQPMNMVDATAPSPWTSAGGDGRAAARALATNPTPAPPSANARSRQQAREERSLASRRRLAEAYRPMIRDVAAGLIERERSDIRQAMHGDDDLRTWIVAYYGDPFRLHARVAIEPVVRALMDAIAGEIEAELSSDPIDEVDLDVEAHRYASVYAKRHAGDSRSRLLARLNAYGDRATRQDDEDDDLDAILADELETWDQRPDEIARYESHRGSNATARWAYLLLGIVSLRWVTMGPDPCEYCQAMSGRRADGGASFLAAGAALKGGDSLVPFIPTGSISHPPLHNGCQCEIAPG